MGMFDSMYDASGKEWQTKALDLNLDRYEVGDQVPGPSLDYQMKVLGDGGFAYATVRAGRLFSLPDERDESLIVIDYSGGWLEGN